VGTVVASSASKLAPVTLAVRESISYSKVMLCFEFADEFSPMRSFKAKAIFQGDCQELNAFAVAFEQSISYSKVKLFTEIGGRVQSKVLFQGDC
jgi:hypothetical protein